jgi:hypothetical protein
MPTGITWLDDAVASTGLPPLADAEAALLIYNQVRRSNLTMEGFRRLPILYRRVGRGRIYEVPHVVEAAKQKILDVKPRLPAPRAPIKSPRTSFAGVNPADVPRAIPIQSPPIATHKREKESESETAS